MQIMGNHGNLLGLYDTSCTYGKLAAEDGFLFSGKE